MAKQWKFVASLATSLISGSALATNGFNLDGYGPISESMGGASMAFDNGGAGMINNPATLALMPRDSARFEFGLGDLMPKVEANGQKSNVKNIYIPGVAYTRKDGDIAWGAGVLMQGGIGTEYSNGNYLGNTAGFGAGNDTSGLNKVNKAELGVGRVVFPLAYSVNENLSIGGSIDYVWAGMDLQWMVDGAHFADMISPGLVGPTSQSIGRINGSLVDTLVAGVQGGQITGLSWGYLNFNKDGQFSRAAKGHGWAGNLGFTYKLTSDFTIGAVYHAKTNLSDLSTGGNSAQFTVNATIGGANTPVPMSGKITVKNFQWPETYGFGMSYQASDSWQFAADYKRINWSGVMRDLNMVFEASGNQANPVAASLVGGGKTLNINYSQNWSDQNILQLGAAYKYSNDLVLRFGASFSNNPIPNSTVSPLFPVILKEHYTAGFGYSFDKHHSIESAFMYAPKVTVTNNWSSVAGSNQTISVGGSSYQVTYNYRF